MDLPTTLYYLFILLPAFYLGLTLTFYTLSALSISLPRSTFYGRTLAAYGTLSACAIYGAFASIILRLAGHRYLSQWATARSFKWSMRYTTDIRFEIITTGGAGGGGGEAYLDGIRPAVVVGNHQSALDILLLGTIWPHYCSVTAKAALWWTPFLGQFMALSGTVFIDRGNSSTARRAFDRAAEVMTRERQSVFIFPEGTRSNTPEPVMGAFKKGAFHLAVRAQVPLLPVVCANYHGVLSVKEGRFRAGRIPVRVLPPVETKGLGSEDVDRLCEQVREMMARELVELTASPLGQKASRADPVGAGEADLARLVQERTRPMGAVEGAVASGVER